VNLRAKVQATIRGQDTTAIDAFVAGDARVLRHLISMTYDEDADLRTSAARAIALAARHHPQQVSEWVRRLVWAMNDESGTNGQTAPEVIQAIAMEQPCLLLPMLPDLVRLAADKELRPLLISAVRLVTRQCPPGTGNECSHRRSEDRVVPREGT